MNRLAPIVLFVYNRPWHTEQTLIALSKNDLANQSILYIYSDGSKTNSTKEEVEKIDEVRKLIRTKQWCKEVHVIEREKNWGLADSIVDGVTEIVNRYGKIIVLEDDLVTSPCFLKFMNEALEFYEGEKDIFSITGFSFPQRFMNFKSTGKDDIYFNIRPMSWSWATWEKRWEGIDWDLKDFNAFVSNKRKIKKFNTGGTDLTPMLLSQNRGEIDSWYVRWSYHAIMRNLYTIYPRISFVNNLGHDGSGVHCGNKENSIYSHHEMNLNSHYNFIKEIKINKKIIPTCQDSCRLK
ncbi:MAG: glycosyltransferase [Spirochaetota bacterium]